MEKASMIKAAVEEYFEKQERLYPNRHKEIHKVCCKNCPSANGQDDPETRDIKEHCSKDLIVKEFLFVCAWRGSKLCKGNCDYNEIDQDYLDNYYGKKP